MGPGFESHLAHPELNWEKGAFALGLPRTYWDRGRRKVQAALRDRLPRFGAPELADIVEWPYPVSFHRSVRGEQRPQGVQVVTRRRGRDAVSLYGLHQ